MSASVCVCISPYSLAWCWVVEDVIHPPHLCQYGAKHQQVASDVEPGRQLEQVENRYLKLILPEVLVIRRRNFVNIGDCLIVVPTTESLANT